MFKLVNGAKLVLLKKQEAYEDLENESPANYANHRTYASTQRTPQMGGRNTYFDPVSSIITNLLSMVMLNY